jgi:multidrug efflux pump subunit AcrA (membrane-fusion protein)
MSSTSPGIARKWVFPILRLVVFAAIAVALAKLAFFGGLTTAGTDSAIPTGGVADPTVQVETGSIANDVVLDASVQADPAVPVRATLAGEIRKVLVTAGQAVAPATPVLTIRSETPNPDGSTSIRTVTVTAGATGVLSALPVLAGQAVSVGDTVGQVAPASFSVVATLPAAQQYRLLNKPTEAKTAITGGPAPFTCTGLTITTPLAGSSSGSGSDTGTGSSGDSGGGSSGGTAVVRCAVPSDVTVFSGLAAKLTIDGGKATDVLVVPTTAVEGATGTGSVYLPSAKGGKPAKQAVTLGLTDGVKVQITGGLKKGDTILEFVPGAPASKNDPANGGIIINGQGG